MKKKLSLSDYFDKKLESCGFSGLLIGLSGGADSVGLILLLANSKIYCKGELKIKALHCNFNLRGEESMRDEQFCIDLCAKLGVELEVVSFRAREEALRRGVSIEVACRDLRYEYFRKKILSEGWNRVAVAHHMDDNAETLLLNLMRGSGANGLKGMIEDNGEVFRPLLSISRTEILEYLKEKSQDYIVDSSNLESDYRRNFLRLEVIPLLESRWPAAKRMIAHSAEILARESRWLDSAMRRGKEGDQLYFHEVMDSPDPVTSIFYFIKGVGGSSSIAEEIWNSINSKDRSSGISGKWWRLDSGLRISLERDHIDILPSGRVPLLQLSEQSYEITPDLLVRIRNERNPEIAWLPYGLGNLEIRPVSEGDRIKLQNGSSALVSKLMKDQHYTRRMKESAPVVVMPDGAIVWVAGLRRSGIAYISDKDKTAHKLYISRNK